MDLLVTYDINTVSDGGVRRLARVAAVCERYGTRVQFSVFECRLSDTALHRLMDELLEVMDTRLDSIFLYRLPGQVEQLRVSLGKRDVRDLGDSWIL